MTRAALVAIALAACGHPHGGGAVPDSSAGGDAQVAIDTALDTAPPIDAAYVPPDPFTLDNCTAMTFAQLVAYFAPGSTSALGGAFTLTSRTRASCNDVTGCSPWVWPSAVEMAQVLERTGYPSGSQHALPSGGSVVLALDTIFSPPSIGLQMQNAEPGTANTIYIPCGDVKQNGVADSLDCSMQVQFPGDYPALVDFVDFYAGAPLFDNTTMVSWHGRICDDGRYQLVTKLAADLGTMVSGANNRNQLAIYGQL
jgi:hypothetical protein